MSSSKTLSIRLNGKLFSLPVIPGEMLADLLRDRLGLTGTKIGCNEAECGTCTVLVGGTPVFSCSYPAIRAQGKEILTIEGLAPSYAKQQPGNALHPLQEAFILHGAVQCGFCTPGQILTANALLQRNSDPSSAEIRQAMAGVLCRCGAYPAIERAIKAAAQSIRQGTPPQAPSIPSPGEVYRRVGQPLIRPDAVQKVTGAAIYSGDLKFENMLYAGVKRAEVPHGILRRLDTAKARRLKGVCAVLTAKDLPAAKNHGLVSQDWPILVGIGERIRYVGDAVALVAAETMEIVATALELIQLTVEPQPVIDHPQAARLPDAPRLHEKGNLLKHIQVRKGDTGEGFAAVDLVIDHTFQIPSAEHMFMEPECSVARLSDEGKMEIYVGSQIPYSDREQVAKALGWREEKVRIKGQFVGGGFGGKEDIAGQIHAALLAQATGRPVRLLFDRHESMLVHPKRHATQIRVKAGVKSDGRLIAVETELYGDTGAYASLGEKVMERATTHSTGPYQIPNVASDCYAMYTNNPPAGAFRGFGVTQSAFAMESMMDMLASRLGMDPIEIRRINGLQEGGITSTGQVLQDSVGLLECIDKVEAEMKKRGGNHPFIPRIDGPTRSAWGFAVAYKNTGFGGGDIDAATAEVELYPDGAIEARTSSAEVGQGLSTVLQLIVSQELDLPPDQVRVLLMDTDMTPDGGATTASRQTYVSGNAVRLAAEGLRQAMVGALAEKIDLPPGEIQFIDGQAIAGGQKFSFPSIYQMMKAERRETKIGYQYQAPATTPLGEGGDTHFAYSFAAQAAQVAVDTRTGEVKVLQVIAANDVGRCLNPLGLLAQAEGGVLMGIGGTLLEEFIVENGQIFTDRMARYRIPTMMHTPQITCLVVEHPTANGPYGAKGVGEIAGIPTAPAIVNAIYHAVGVRVDHLPAKPEYIWKSMQDPIIE